MCFYKKFFVSFCHFVTSMEPLIRKNRISYIRPLSLFLFEVPLNRKIVKNDSSTYFSYGLLSRHNGVKLSTKRLQDFLTPFSPSTMNFSTVNFPTPELKCPDQRVSHYMYCVPKRSRLVCGIWDL